MNSSDISTVQQIEVHCICSQKQTAECLWDLHQWFAMLQTFFSDNLAFIYQLVFHGGLHGVYKRPVCTIAFILLDNVLIPVVL